MNKIQEKADELTEALKQDLGEIEMKVVTGYTLADAIREGCKVSDQAYTWGNGDTACALSAAVIAATSRGFIKE
jgi:predicted RNase H-like nuclease (RuvC/YqgF family)